MSISRARWSDTEKKAVLDCYNVALDADEFFVLLHGALGASFFRRTVKAYLTYLNDTLLPKTDPRRPVYQSLCEANQKEIAANKAAEAVLYGQPSVPTPVTAAAPATPAPVAATPAPNYNWVTEEVDVVPRVPPGRAVPRSLFMDPQAAVATGAGPFPTLTEALATQARDRAAEEAAKQNTVRELLATEEGRQKLAASMTSPVRGTPAAVSAEPVAKPVVTPDPRALVPRHYPALPQKAKLTADEIAQVFGIARIKVVDAFAYGFVQTLDGSYITYHTAQRIHDAMSEGHSFSEACRLVNPNSTGLLPMTALIEEPDEALIEEQSPTVVPGFEAGKVTLKVDGWVVEGGPMNPKSVAKMAADLNAHGPFVTSVEVRSGPKSLFQGGEVFPVVQSVEVPAQPAKTVETQSIEDMADHILEDIGVSPSVAQAVTKAMVEGVTAGAFEDYTLEAVRDGVITVAQAVDILNPSGTHKAVWALSLLAAGKITIAQCDRLLFAKSV